jgi:hypothetical protein
MVLLLGSSSLINEKRHSSPQEKLLESKDTSQNIAGEWNGRSLMRKRFHAKKKNRKSAAFCFTSEHPCGQKASGRPVEISGEVLPLIFR